MKIIEPSATIIEDELSQLSIYQRIDTCGAVCYQRPPKPTDEEAQEFCRKMVASRHFATLEMAVVHLWVDETNIGIPESKYITKTDISGFGDVVVSGSIRAFIECIEQDCYLFDFFKCNFPLFFGQRGTTGFEGMLRFAQPHEIPWQHKHVAVKFIVNRAVSHEMVRHRPCSFLQESQRYCRYEDEVVFIRPEWATGYPLELDFAEDCSWDEQRYKYYLREGLSPQQARVKLPNSTKTELIVYASLPQWLHIFSLRDSKAADPEMVRVMKPLHQEFREKYPEAFA